MATALPSLADYIKVSNREMSFTESWSKPSSYFNDTSGDGNVSWNATTRTLTLKDFGLNRTSQFHTSLNCLIVDSKQSITIEVKG